VADEELSEEERIQAAYDDHECEFCGEMLPDPGPSFLKHLDESDTCRYLWLRHRPLVQEEAGGS
jgi:hypothetical protein